MNRDRQERENEDKESDDEDRAEYIQAIASTDQWNNMTNDIFNNWRNEVFDNEIVFNVAVFSDSYVSMFVFTIYFLFNIFSLM